MIDIVLFEYANFISYTISLRESRIETEVNTANTLKGDDKIYSQQFASLLASFLPKIAFVSDAFISVGNEFHRIPPPISNHRRRCRGGVRGSVAPKYKLKGGGGLIVTRSSQNIANILDIIPDIEGFRVHIFFPQTTQGPYLRSTIKEDRQNNCILMHCHKLITDTLDTVSVEMAKRVASANEKSAQRVFWKISVEVWHG